MTSRAHRLPIATLALILAAAPAARARAQSDTDAPAWVNPDYGTGEALLIAGSTVLLASWALTGAAASTLVYLAAARDETIVESWIPVIGPWIMAVDSAGFDGLQLAGTIISGVLQLAGLAGLIAGVVLMNQGPPDGAVAALTLAPLAGGGALGLSGRF